MGQKIKTISGENRINWLDTDFPEHPVTRTTRRNVTRFSHRVRGSVRVAMGGFATDAELERRRRAVAELP